MTEYLICMVILVTAAGGIGYKIGFGDGKLFQIRKQTKDRMESDNSNLLN